MFFLDVIVVDPKIFGRYLNTVREQTKMLSARPCQTVSDVDLIGKPIAVVVHTPL